MKTLEQFELGLVKIKEQVGPEHVGHTTGGYLDASGDPCIMARFFMNQGVQILPQVSDYRRFDPAGLQRVLTDWDIAQIGKDPVYGVPLMVRTGSPVCDRFEAAVRMNDSGSTWHQIVDALVPPEKYPKMMEAIEATVVEESKSTVAVLVPPADFPAMHAITE